MITKDQLYSPGTDPEQKGGDANDYRDILPQTFLEIINKLNQMLYGININVTH